MNNILFFISILAAKSINKTIRFLRLGQGGTLAGKLAVKIYPDLLKNFKYKNNHRIILITGTNGKSTTSGILASILESCGKKVAYNKSGANLISGIATTLCFFANLKGFLDYDFIILEVDEAALQHVTKQINSHIIAVTNLFRDQLDRFGELDTTLKLIEKGISNNRNAFLILNADDSKLLSIKADNEKIFFGFKNNSETTDIQSDWLSDPIELGEKSPTTIIKNFLGCNLKTDSLSSSFEIKHDSFTINKQLFFLPFIGMFNIYNALCAVAIAKTITNVTPVQIQKGFSTYSTIFGRAEKINIHNKSAWIYLIKNPAGTTEVLKTLTKQNNARFLIALNDNIADGRDVSWIWDARFDLLDKHNKQIFVTGKRAYDMALRLKYGNVGDIVIEEDIEDAIKLALSNLNTNEILFILPTYTALLEMQKKKISKEQPL